MLLTMDDARQKELAFISRFDHAMRKQGGIICPWDGKRVRVKDWDAVNREEPTLLLTEGVLPLPRPGDRTVPRRNTSFYSCRGQQQSERFGVGVACFSHTAAYEQEGRDTQAATQQELALILRNALELVRSYRARLAIGLASLTGWESAAEGLIRGSSAAPAFTNERLAVCLIDLSQYRQIFNADDAVIRKCLGLFAGTISAEMAERVKTFVLKEVVNGVELGVTARRVCDETGAEMGVVEKAFVELERQGSGRVQRQGIEIVFLGRLMTNR